MYMYIYIYTSIFVTYIQYCNTYDAMRAFNINSTNINNVSMFSSLLILSELNSETKGSQKDDDNTTSFFILKVILGRINTSKEETITKERLEKRDSRDSKTSINDNNTDNNNKGTRLVLPLLSKPFNCNNNNNNNNVSVLLIQELLSCINKKLSRGRRPTKRT